MLQRVFILTLFSVTFSLVVLATDGDQSPSPSETSDDETKLTFTDKVKTVRAAGGDYDVFFVKHRGPYSVPYSLPNSKGSSRSPEDILNDAYKKGMEITVTVNVNTDTLVSIDSDLSRIPTSEPPPESNFEPPANMKYIKDIIRKANEDQN